MTRLLHLNILRYWYSILSVVLLQGIGFAQPSTTSVKYYVQHLDAEDGLEHDKLNAFINTDSKGFQWIASSSGVYRFDGKSFSNYLPEHDSLQALVQSNFFEDTRGRIWFSTVDALNCYSYETDAVTSHVFAKAPNNNSAAYYILHYDSTRNELFLSNNQSIWIFNPDASTAAQQLCETSSVRYLPLRRDTSSIILGFPWFLGPGIERLELNDGNVVKQSWSQNTLIKTSRINGGIEDDQGRVWLGTNIGLIWYDVNKDSVLGHYPSPDQSSKEVWSPVVFGNKIAVSTSKSGVWIFDPITGKYFHSLAAQALATGDNPKKSPRTLHVTPSGELFAMCRDQGIDVYTPVANPAIELYDSRGMPVAVTALSQDQYKQVWVTTTDGNLHLYDEKATLKHSFENALNTNNPILNLEVEKDRNQALVNDRFNILRITLNVERLTVKVDTVSSFEQPIRGIIINSDGIPFVRTQNAWYRIGEKGLQKIDHRILNTDSSNDVIIIGDNKYAFSPADQWLYIFSYSNHTINILDSISTTGAVWTAKELNKNTYALGTTNGFTSNIKDEDFGLQGEEIYKFYTKDNTPNIALTNNGILFKETMGQWKKQGRNVGLEGLFNDKSSMLISENRIWLGSERGLFSFNKPTFNSSSDKITSPYVARTWINDRPWPKGLWLDQDRILLDYDENTIELDVNIMQNVGTVTPGIIYRLIGYQPAWTTLRGENNIRFTKVHPGTYQLEIAVVSSKGNAEQTTSIEIQINSPFWQTWWFYTLAILASIGLTTSLIGIKYRRRLAQEQQKREREQLIARERDRIGKELHDDLGGELATILFLGQREVRKQASTNTSRIVELTKASLANMRDIIWALEGSDTTLGGLIAYAQRHGATMCADRSTEFQFTNNVDSLACRKELGPRIRRNIFLLIKEAINNSLRHSNTPLILLTFSYTEGTLIANVVDKGLGFEANVVKCGNGMKNLQSRAKALHGECEISSTIGAGTTVCFKLPLA